MAKNGKRHTLRRTGLIAALDIGTKKTVCFIARQDEQGELQVIGVGQRPSQGVRAGAIVDVDAARDTVVNVVHLAEAMAGETIRSVVVSLSCGDPQSEHLAVEVAIDGHEVTAADVRRVLEQGRQYHSGARYELIHSIPVGYRVDKQRNIVDPRNLYGNTLGVDMHVVQAESGPVRSLATVLASAHLDIEAFVVTPFAAGLSVLVEDEMHLGATIIDMGAGVTSMGVFEDGELVFTASVPVGGSHVTTDIAHGLSTPLNHAERLKTAYGAALASTEDKEELLDVPQMGVSDGDIPNHMPKSVLTGIIQPRMEETFELVRAQLERGGFNNSAARQVVLTGGASQMARARDLAARILDRNVRLGRPRRHNGLAEAASGPAFASCAGLLDYAVRPNGEDQAGAVKSPEEKRGVIGRLGSWLNEHL